MTTQKQRIPARMDAPRHTIVYASDAGYWSHTYVSIYSLLVNNTTLPLDVYIIAPEPDPDFFEHARQLRLVHPDATVQWLEVDEGSIEGITSSIGYISMATYYRLFLGDLLPEDVERILYIDGDTVVRGSIRELLELDISDVLLAATPEYGDVPHNCRLGLPDGAPYFNAGVLLVNLSLWRKEDAGRRCLAYIREHGEALLYNDQDAMNAVLTDRWNRFGPTYNYTHYTLDERRYHDFDVKAQLGGIVPANGPAIAHYAGAAKPWHGGSLHEYEADYWSYRMQTPYANRRMMLRSKLAMQNKLYNSYLRFRRNAVTTIRKTPLGNTALRKAKSLFRTAT